MADRPGRSPLYLQVRSELIERISTGAYKPGEALANEFAIAAEFSVSQGTARKALDSLAKDGLIVRRQGLGTYIPERTPADMLFRFFKIYTATGERVQPSSGDVRVSQGKGNVREAGVLGIEPGSAVTRIVRTRFFSSVAIIRETIVVAEQTFPGLGREGSVPNTLYDHFQHRYGVTVTNASEQVEAVAAAKRVARHLQVEIGTPLIRIDRTTYDLAGRAIEWRVSFCHLPGLHYRAEMA